MPQALKEIVPVLVQSVGISEKNFAVASLIEHEVQKSAPRSTVAAYKNNIIYVEVESSVQLFELNLRRREILKVLEAIPGARAPEIRFFLKGLAKPSAADRLGRIEKPGAGRN